MKCILSVLVLLVSLNVTQAQVKFEKIESSRLGDTREIKIQLPRGYGSDKNKTYPLFIVFDGDYLFEAVVGNTDYYSYWEDMPEAIVVGVNQYGKRYDDCLYSEQNSLPIESGASFFEFVGMELIPYIQNKYKIGNFKVAVGHGETANFINYFLLKPQPIFQGYIAMSPVLAPGMIKYLPGQLSKTASKIFYYLSYTNNDIGSVKEMAKVLNQDMSTVNNKNVVYKYQGFEGPSHYSAPAHALPNAIETIFSVYKPISKQEYQDVILKLEDSPVAYLEAKYQSIYDLFGIKKPILVNDFRAIAAAIEKKETFEDFERLGDLARDAYPDTLLGNYYLARFYEETGDAKKAMKTYQSAYILDEIGGITKDLMVEKAEAIKADFGY
ncbi:alpha/beta hydrolase-fold protein [Aestuariibaculum sp. M13]|uniref:alpha/beta hydrolase n=1 Tax=Aestuariibaculum sp. M13 TaxID=2967132 RepID=UPI002159E02F|nr:alpha/beta hydrolase-fold protein [Aestuariibaculum sp. M13]MCR8667036.1 alpha/beta hydrolase-fold protein [Aestuariibaculum sp. M13]